MSSVKVVGMDRVIRRLDQLDRKAQTNLEQLVKAALQEIVREAKRLAPIRDVNGGKYRSMLSYRTDGLSGYAAPLRRGNKTSAIGHLLEFGTIHARAFPHLFPAFRMVTAIMGPRIEDALRKAGR